MSIGSCLLHGTHYWQKAPYEHDGTNEIGAGHDTAKNTNVLFNSFGGYKTCFFCNEEYLRCTFVKQAGLRVSPFIQHFKSRHLLRVEGFLGAHVQRNVARLSHHLLVVCL